MFRFDRHAIHGLLRHHVGVAGEQFDHQAFLIGHEMQDKDAGHTRAGRKAS